MTRPPPHAPAAPPIATVAAIAATGPHDDTITLDYEARFVRRKRLVSDGGRAFLIDLPQARALANGEVLTLTDGSGIRVQAAREPLLEVRGDLPRLAWHIGNRHTPCRIEADRLLIRADPVLARMLTQLGAQVTEGAAPFSPEGGAYGHGRTFGHSHAPDTHDGDTSPAQGRHADSHGHGHGHSHGHGHPHPHPHAHAPDHGQDHGHDHGHRHDG